MKTINMVLPNDYKVIAIENSSSIADEIWKEKFYERDFDIKPGMTVLDIGANQGFFSLYAASKGAKVISVEPDDVNFGILAENIRLNGLEDRIKALKTAISTTNGKIEAYSYDFDEQYASGMVSTTKDFLEKTNLILNRKITTKLVESVSLRRLFEDEQIGRIDLLKIDCEGAEYDIMQSAISDEPEAPRNGTGIFGMIENIVMETHDTYPEKDIFHLVRHLGYEVIHYEKLSGLYKTGYLFAGKAGLSSKPALTDPEMLIENAPPPYWFTCDEFRIDASKSFSTADIDAKLVFDWKINGRCLNNDIPLLAISFIKTGMYKIELELKDEFGGKSFICFDIWIFRKGYFDPGKNVKRLGQKEKYSIECFKGKNEFTLDTAGSWIPYRVMLEITYKASGNRSGNHLEFNGNRFLLENEFNEIGIDNFPQSIVRMFEFDLDMNFSINLAADENIEIYCWSADKKYFDHRDLMNSFVKKMKTGQPE